MMHGPINIRWVDNVGGILEETQCGGVKRSQWRVLVNTVVVFLYHVKSLKSLFFFPSNGTVQLGLLDQKKKVKLLGLGRLTVILRLYLPSYFIASGCLTKFLNAFHCCSCIFKTSVDIRGPV